VPEERATATTESFELPDPGEGIHEAEIVEVKAKEGQEVSEGDPLFTIETDKATTDVEAPFTGTIESVKVEAGDIVEVGQVLVTYTKDENGSEDPARSEDAERSEDDEGGSEDDEGSEDEEEETQEEAKGGDGAARRDPPIPAAPTTRRLARKLDVDLKDVDGSGPEGRVTDRDVRAFAETGEGREREEQGAEKSEESETSEKDDARPLRPASPELPDFRRFGPVEEVLLKSVRRATAERMTVAWAEIPHVTHTDVADITELEALRRDLKGDVERRGGRLSLTVLVMKAAVAALKAFPRFNASLDPESGKVLLKRYHHLGVAVDSDRGLLVPVIRDVDRKSVSELAVELAELVQRTRDGEVSREELQGGTFTITNPGPIGGTGFTPIINHPEVAILGLARAAWEPTDVGDGETPRIEPRLRLPLCLAFDHRVADGAEAARFTKRIVDSLESGKRFLLDV
jgi:pyruvate dehydrogenase E2 component (dihydrolipoamide acetyltransferase)